MPNSKVIADTLAVANKAINMPKFGSMVFNTLLGLFIVIILIYLILYMVKKLSPYGKLSQNKNSKILGILPINTKQQVYVVKIYDKIYILGSSPNNLNKIDVIENPESIQQIINQSTSNKGFNSFMQKFKKDKN